MLYVICLFYVISFAEDLSLYNYFHALSHQRFNLYNLSYDNMNKDTKETISTEIECTFLALA